jgi:integrase
LLALLLACGLRRHEAVALTLDHLQQREEHWAIVDLVGKGGPRSNGSGSRLGEERVERLGGRSGY